MNERNHMLILIAIMAFSVYCLIWGESGKTLNRELCIKFSEEFVKEGRAPLPCYAKYKGQAAGQGEAPTPEPTLTPEQRQADFRAAVERIRQRDWEAAAEREAAEREAAREEEEQ